MNNNSNAMNTMTNTSIESFNRSVIDNIKAPSIFTLPRNRAVIKAKANVTRNISRKFLNAGLRNNSTKGGLKEFSKAAILIKSAVANEFFYHPDLHFGPYTLGVFLSILVVKEWQMNRTELVKYKTLLLSSVSDCTKNWLKEGLSDAVEKLKRYEETRDDNRDYDRIIRWALNSYTTNDDFNKLNIPIGSLPFEKYTKFSIIAKIIASGFINSNNQWFVYEDNRPIDFVNEDQKNRFAHYCGVEPDSAINEIPKLYVKGGRKTRRSRK